MLFMVDACFRRAVHAVRARRCSGFLRELELGRPYWSPPAAHAGLVAWALFFKASLLVGGALCLTYGCVFDRGRRGCFASALRTLARAANLALLRLIRRACDLALPHTRCVASHICCRAAT